MWDLKRPWESEGSIYLTKDGAPIVKYCAAGSVGEDGCRLPLFFL